MREPCMCGDTHCGVCGPLQGYYKCPNCGRWNDDEDENGVVGCINPEECAAKIKAMDEAEAEDYFNGLSNSL